MNKKKYNTLSRLWWFSIFLMGIIIYIESLRMSNLLEGMIVFLSIQLFIILIHLRMLLDRGD